MKCKWYADFEGTCTNGECPYRGDTCPTSEYPEVCKYAEKQTEIPQLSAEELAKTLRLCDSASCTDCVLYGFYDCGGIINPQAADMLEKLATEKEAKNRVLTLEEVEAYCEGGADAAPLWYDSKDYSDANRWMVIDLPELAFGSAPTVKRLVNSQFYEPTYGEKWRCWLRKPTEAERRGTPWACDSRE